jgi:hypothetical protein
MSSNQTARDLGQPEHDEAETFSNAPSTENPASEPFNIVVSVPEAIQIRMVDASSLADYELWVFIASLISNFVVGFLVAYSQAIDSNSPAKTYVGWTLLLFVLLFAISLTAAIRKRLELRKKGRDIKLKTSSAATAKGS